MNFAMTASCKTALHAVSVIVPIVTALLLAGAWFIDGRIQAAQYQDRQIAAVLAEKLDATNRKVDATTARLDQAVEKLDDKLDTLVQWTLNQGRK